MREFPGFIQTRDAAADYTSVALDVGDDSNYYIQIMFTGADVVGTLSLEASPDNTNWVTVSGSTQAVTASTDHAWNASDVHYRYVRVIWDYTSGTGNMSAYAQINQPIRG